ncbi:MAG TPA: hypothetical protein PK369_10035 [Thermoclostridium sp.]|uniref:hypothetical protein n=1 Tax=Thermoclostridium caenicola TaxID=659425 RepID=UPI002BBA23F5|nr:hypothetical protein [Thermoclostridium caenicola]HOK43467.1 hypothetical protein [Thermoclostridium caenicola]HOQ76889.1 hypothetical protein [Thermoclostridium sp.]HPO77738.1 hypothetical protein [Thermoclostridium caenicola]HPU45976.1 hypothetical protein [Thermoclostridium sp.]
MDFIGRILERNDPDYTVEFSFFPESGVISGTAQIARKYPQLKINYDDQSARKIETLPKKDRTKLELEIANLVLNDLLKGKGRSYMILKRKSFTQ